jgi:DivIVA domain-containing protein
MAISFSRPDPSSPAAVGSAAFPVNRRGFDQAEVRDFLKMVAAEMARLQERERFLEGELRALQTRGLSVPGRLDEETVTTLLGEEAARVLTAARDASTQIRDRAEESATRLVKDAAEDASRIRESAVIEATRIREDSVHDAESEIDMAKQQGRDMVNEAREYREKVLSELSRRRDAARGQIEQLLHGRDRLMNAFERARIATEDVIGGLTDAHDEPEFIVDLSPTTGPIPIVNPEHPSVKVFDREAVVETPANETNIAPEDVVIFDHESDVVEITQEEIAEIIEDVQRLVDEQDAAPSEHPVHEILGEQVVVDAPEDKTTNVVSLFGRHRKTVVPVVDGVISSAEEISVVVVEETEAPAPSFLKKSVPEVDDIFAKLRAGSTAKVAEKVDAVSSPALPISKKPKEVPAVPEAKPEKAQTKAGKKAKKVAVIAADPARFESRDEALSEQVVTLARKLKRVLADEQNDVLQHLRLKKSSLEIDVVFGTPMEQAQRYAGAIAEEAMASASAGAKSVKSSGGSGRRVTQKAITDHTAATVVVGLVAAFREEARIAIGEAEGDREVLSGLMRDVYRKWKMELIDSHVDDIACSAYSKGAYLALEPGATISWMVDPAAACCSECEDNSLAGAVIRGDDFPAGHPHPPAHPGCRCLVSPV